MDNEYIETRDYGERTKKWKIGFFRGLISDKDVCIELVEDDKAEEEPQVFLHVGRKRIRTDSHHKYNGCLYLEDLQKSLVEINKSVLKYETHKKALKKKKRSD